LSLGQLASADDQTSHEDSETLTQLHLLHSANVAGILDIKWCDGIYGREEAGLPLFAAADANGDLSLWSVNRMETTGAAECCLVEVMSTEEAGSLALSVDWSTVICRR